MTGMPSETQLDALREVANIGCGNAATALSKLVGGRTVRIDVPRVLAADAADVAGLIGGDDPVLAVALEIEGEVRGRLVLIWPEGHAAELARLLLGAQADVGPFQEPCRSALEEVGNIVGSACLSAIGTLARLRLVPSTPLLTGQTGSELADEVLADAGSRKAVVLETRFYTAQVPPLSGQLLLVPERRSLPNLFRALGL